MSITNLTVFSCLISLLFLIIRWYHFLQKECIRDISTVKLLAFISCIVMINYVDNMYKRLFRNWMVENGMLGLESWVYDCTKTLSSYALCYHYIVMSLWFLHIFKDSCWIVNHYESNCHCHSYVLSDEMTATEGHIIYYWFYHYNDVIMGAMASQITSLTSVYSTVYSDADQRKLQSSTSLAFVWGIHRRPVNSPRKWPVTRKMFPFDDVIMT